MTKSELINKVADRTGCSKKDTAKIYDAIFDEIKNAVSAGDYHAVKDFGRFFSKTNSERLFRNPLTNETSIIKAHNTPKFSPANAFKTSVNT